MIELFDRHYHPYEHEGDGKSNKWALDDRTFKKIREVLHPDTEIVRCDRCQKAIRIFIGDERICGGCSE